MPWWVLHWVEVAPQISHKSFFQECRGELLLYGQDTKHQFWWFNDVLCAPAEKELAGVPGQGQPRQSG